MVGHPARAVHAGPGPLSLQMEISIFNSRNENENVLSRVYMSPVGDISVSPANEVIGVEPHDTCTKFAITVLKG